MHMRPVAVDKHFHCLDPVKMELLESPVPDLQNVPGQEQYLQTKNYSALAVNYLVPAVNYSALAANYFVPVVNYSVPAVNYFVQAADNAELVRNNFVQAAAQTVMEHTALTEEEIVLEYTGQMAD